MEDEVQRKLPAFEIGMELSELSVEEIENLISTLNEEIARLKETAKAKSSHLSAAAALFKS